MPCPIALLYASFSVHSRTRLGSRSASGSRETHQPFVRVADLPVQAAAVDPAVRAFGVDADQAPCGQPDQQQVVGVAEADVDLVAAAQIRPAGGAVA